MEHSEVELERDTLFHCIPTALPNLISSQRCPSRMGMGKGERESRVEQARTDLENFGVLNQPAYFCSLAFNTIKEKA
jgi:hypothetical protein